MKGKDLFDFSDYPKNLQFYDPMDKQVIDKMKNEIKGTLIDEIVGLKSKIYSLIAENNKEIKKAVCVNKKVVSSMRYKEYTDCCFVKK